MIETVQGGSIRVSRDKRNAELECEQSTGEVTYYDLDHQGVTALIKELEEVREKLPKPKIKKTIYVNLYENGEWDAHDAFQTAISWGEKKPISRREEITWEVDDE